MNFNVTGGRGGVQRRGAVSMARHALLAGNLR